MEPRDTCASVARAIDEPLAGTAPVASGWLAIEVPGSWGRQGLTDSRLDADVVHRLSAAADAAGVRIQLIRQPRGKRGPNERRTMILAHSGPSAWCEVLDLADDDYLDRIDPAVCASPEPPGLGRVETGPLLLVCTHAKRDRCCATLGRPVADTLAALHPDRVWETSHTGGHRFAANLVILPEGLVYGGLDVAGAVETVAHHLAGRLDVDHLRGRSSLDRPAQAAEVLARERLGHDSGALRVVEVADTGDGTVRARVATAGAEHLAVLTRVAHGTPRHLSCDSDELEDPPAYRLRELVQIERSG